MGAENTKEKSRQRIATYSFRKPYLSLPRSTHDSWKSAVTDEKFQSWMGIVGSNRAQMQFVRRYRRLPLSLLLSHFFSLMHDEGSKFSSSCGIIGDNRLAFQTSLGMRKQQQVRGCKSGCSKSF